MSADTARTIEALAELAVGLGANVQSGQILSVSSEPGKEPLARAIAEVAYARGVTFVDVVVFDQHVKRARLRHAAPETLTFVPSWYGDRVRRLGEERAAMIGMTGPIAPGLMDDVDPALLGLDLLPRVKETTALVEERLVNWTAIPCPTAGWAARVHPELEGDAALERLWEEIAHICRLRSPTRSQPGLAPRSADGGRLDARRAVARRSALRRPRHRSDDRPPHQFALDRRPLQTAGGIVHVPNLPTEEVFTAPDPHASTAR